MGKIESTFGITTAPSTEGGTTHGQAPSKNHGRTLRLRTLAGNMRHAFIERTGAKIGGGQFSPEELREGHIAIHGFLDLLPALEALELACDADIYTDDSDFSPVLDNLRAVRQQARDLIKALK